MTPDWYPAIRECCAYWNHAVMLQQTFEALEKSFVDENDACIDCAKSIVEVVCRVIVDELDNPARPAKPQEEMPSFGAWVSAAVRTLKLGDVRNNAFQKLVSQHHKLTETLGTLRNGAGPVSHGRDGFIARLSVYHRRSPGRVLPVSEKFFKALVILGWPITVGIFMLAPQFDILLGMYPQSGPALQILALAIVFMFADNTFAATLNAIDKQNVFAFVAMVGLVVNVGVNLVVIPRYGYLGASWAVVVTEAALVVVGWFVLRAQLGTIRVVSTSWKAIVAGVVMGAFIYVANPHDSRLMLFVVVFASAAIYVSALLALRVADSEELSLIRNALRVRR